MTAELGAEQLARFRQMLQKRRLDPNDYVFMPVHPWQWRHKLVGAFAPDIARGDLVYLGHGEDDYQPQQSIRTFFNIDRPERCYVKTSISVLNMGFIRGLSPGYMQATPAINDWLFELVEADPYFQEKGFSVIREVASVGYHTRYYHEATEKNTAHKKMLSALWRESVVPRLKPNQRLMSMAALLHRDPQGDAFLKPLIQASGQSVSDWLERYLDCYMSPLLHCFFAHDLVFLPHGENVILILEDNLCISAVMKDTAEEIGVFDKAERLPEPAKRVAVPVPEEVRILSLLTDLLDCFFRFLVDVLEEEELCTAEDFWRLAAQTVHRYEARFPEGREKYLKHDMFVKSFQLSCLNRLQLRDRYQLIDLADPAGSLMFAGMLDNPLAPFGRDRR